MCKCALRFAQGDSENDIGIAMIKSSNDQFEKMVLPRNIFILVSFAIIAVLTSACGLISGSSIHQNVRVNLPGPVVVRDVYTGDTLAIDSVESNDETIGVVRLRNGRRHALSFSTDSSVAYRTTDLKRNWWTLLNYFNYGVGCLVDQVLETNYDISPKWFSKFTFQKLAPDERQAIEDSLRIIERYSVPHSIIDGRTNFVVSLWGSMSIAGPQASQFPFFNIFSYGIGLAPFPYLQVFYDVNSIFTSDQNFKSQYANDIISHDNVSRTFGIAVLEPRFGLLGSWRYGTGRVKSYRTEVSRSVPINLSDLTTYSLSLGFYGQWGKVEYRHMRITSITNQIPMFEIPTVLNGVYWSMQVML